jgi:hypothetical protein
MYVIFSCLKKTVRYSCWLPADLQAAHARETEELKAKCARLETDVASLKDILENESMEVESLQVRRAIAMGPVCLENWSVVQIRPHLRIRLCVFFLTDKKESKSSVGA